ncbi:MAG: hypothetical protein U1D55_02630 [Phycisphaerae bacterium]
MCSSGQFIRISRLLPCVTVCVLMTGCGGVGDVASVFSELGLPEPPADAFKPWRVVGGDNSRIVFARLNGPAQALLRLSEPGFDAVAAGASTSVVVTNPAGDAVVGPFDLPFAMGVAYADHRWLVLGDTALRRVYAVDLDGGTTTNAWAERGAVSTQVLGLSAGRILIQAYVRGAMDGWVVQVVDVPTGQVTTLATDYAISGAIDGDKVALLFDNAVPAPVPLDDGTLVPAGGESLPSISVDSHLSRIVLFNLPNGTSDTIAQNADSLSAPALGGGHLVWYESAYTFDPRIDASQDRQVALRSFDTHTAMTTTAMEWTESADIGGMSDYMTIGAVGDGGFVVTHQTTSADSPANQHYRFELRGWDGGTTLIQEYDQTARNLVYYDTNPVIVGRRLIYREPFSGNWMELDTSTGATIEISPPVLADASE